MGRRILCKVKDHHDLLILYRDGTWRYQKDKYDPNNIGMWELRYEDSIPKFYYKGYKSRCASVQNWATEWDPNDEVETKISNTIVNALLEVEVEKMLKGE